LANAGLGWICSAQSGAWCVDWSLSPACACNWTKVQATALLHQLSVPQPERAGDGMARIRAPGLASRNVRHDREHGRVFGRVGADPTLINRTLRKRSRPAQHGTGRTSVPEGAYGVFLSSGGLACLKRGPRTPPPTCHGRAVSKSRDHTRGGRRVTETGFSVMIRREHHERIKEPLISGHHPGRRPPTFSSRPAIG
jgi:hypothetical protein